MAGDVVDGPVDAKASEPPKSAATKGGRPRGGAELGNRNSIRHGLSAGQLPKGCSHVAKAAKRFRSALEAAVIKAKGRLSLMDLATVNSAIRWERHAQLAQTWLRTSPNLTPEQQLLFSREVAQASSQRDRCMRMLELEPDTQAALLAKLYGRRDRSPPTINGTAREGAKPTPGPSPAAGPQNASQEPDSNGAHVAPEHEEQKP